MHFQNSRVFQIAKQRIYEPQGKFIHRAVLIDAEMLESGAARILDSG